jgi:hypothetical protein
MGDDLEEFIIQRSRTAELSLEGSLKKGIHMDVAKEAAFELLFESLKFSKYDYILNIFEENYPEKYSQLSNNKQLKQQIVTYVEKCCDLFEKYKTGDDFTGDNKLYNEVLGTIEIELEKDAVQ